ncbi:Diaphanous FH3 Domaincontaining protein [Acanthamoeba castellanii str. Neff]|uniref:Diaphanous FH3 Domaincontaining protein n=1 Tax=Acanthamoeba castellanii (strain ATCC 30010 / Neff) TaxID=1257118 RepID=L8GQR6_ACACF|nr:Diaphanous FH3 Domaincontaining protein [Acanthamoeba castellanii str. Neff]ELR15247.1 Diaphanous FH3 Domaincontaining protein [Acanthamoeba castellanii str. Neff]
MKKFFSFGKKKKKENDLKEKEEEGYDAVDDDYNEDGDDDTSAPAPAPVTRRDSRARFSTSLPSVHGGSGESVPTTQHGRSSGLATSSAAGSSPPSSSSSSSPATRPHASTVSHYASSTSSAGHAATSAAAGTSSPPLVTNKPFEGLGIGGAQAGDRSSIGRGSVERKVAAFSAFQAAQAPAPGPNATTKERSVTMNSTRPGSNQVPSGGGVAGAVASAAAASGAPRPTRRVELQRTRSHSHKREELNSNSSMPSKEKIELLFSKYLREQDLPREKKDVMKKWSSLDKWKQLQQQEQKEKDTEHEAKKQLLASGVPAGTPQVSGPIAVVHVNAGLPPLTATPTVSAPIMVTKPSEHVSTPTSPRKAAAQTSAPPRWKIMESQAFYISALQTEFTLRLVEALAQTLSRQAVTWQHQFEKLGGFAFMLKNLADLEKKTVRTDEEKLLISACISCLKVVMNNKKEGALKTIALGLDHPDVKTKIMVLELLTTVCMARAPYPPDPAPPLRSHTRGADCLILFRLIVEAMTNFKAVKREKARFNQLLVILKRSKSVELKTNALGLVNAVVNVPSDIDQRMHYRNEFIRLGLKRILKALKKEQLPEDLATQIEVYDEESRADQEELDQRFSDMGVDDIDDMHQVFTALSKSAKAAGLAPSLLSLMRHLCLFPVGEEGGVRAYVLAERLVQQVALQKSNIALDEVGGVHVNLEELSLAVKGASDSVALNRKLEALQAKMAESKKKKKQKDQLIIEKEAIIRLMDKQRQAERAKFEEQLKQKDVEAKEKMDDVLQQRTAEHLREREQWVRERDQWERERKDWAHDRNEWTRGRDEWTHQRDELEREKEELQKSRRKRMSGSTYQKPAGSAGGEVGDAAGAEAEAPPPLPASPRSRPRQTNNNSPGVQRQRRSGSFIGGSDGASPSRSPVLPRSGRGSLIGASGDDGPPPLPPTPAKAQQRASGDDELPTPAKVQLDALGFPVDDRPPSLPPTPGRSSSNADSPAPNNIAAYIASDEEYRRMKQLLAQLLGREGEVTLAVLKQIIEQRPAAVTAALSTPTPVAADAKPDDGGAGPNNSTTTAPDVAEAPAAPLRPRPRSRKIQKPSIKLKGYQWVKLPDAKIKNTVWGSFDFQKQIRFDWNEIEEIFAANPLPTKERSSGSTIVKPEARAHVLNAKKSQNIAIMLARLKQPNEVIKKAILSLDEMVLTKENIRMLHAFGPTAEEIDQIKDHVKKDSEKPPESRVALADPEQLFLELSSVSNLEERLRFFLYKLEFADKLAEIRPGVETVRVATTEFNNNKKWMQILELVLFLGNFVNEGTFRGGINGFKLSKCFGNGDQMMDVRGVDGRTTLLHYLAKIIRNEHMELLDFTDELSHCADAARVSLSSLKSDTSTLKYGRLDLIRAKDVLYILDETLVETEQLFKSVLTFYAEDPQCDPEEFFTVISSFCSAFEKAAEENEREKKASERAAKRAAQKEEKDKKVTLRRQPTRAGSAVGKMPLLDEEDEGVVDDILNTLREGSVFRHRRLGVSTDDKGQPNIAMNVLADFTKM